MDDVIVDLRDRSDDLFTVSKLFAEAYLSGRVFECDVYAKSRYAEILSDYFGLQRPMPLYCVPGLRL